MGDSELSEEARKCLEDARKTSGKLSDQARKWVADALKNSSKRSADIVIKTATSLARSEKMKEELQNGVWEGSLVLHHAARNGCELLFRLLLEEFLVDPNLVDPFTGTSTLHHAAASGHKKMLQTLLKKYLCYTEAKDVGGSTPVCIAVAFGQNPALRLLLKSKASIDVESYLGMPIHSATYVGNTEAIRILYESNPDAVNAELYGFCTPLVAAALYESTDCFKLLVEVADLNAKPLFYKVICYSDSEELVKERIDILLKREANPNLFDQNVLFEELPVLCAAKRGWEVVVNTLLKHTDQIPEVNNWSVQGVIEYVKSHNFRGNNDVERENRVDALKERLLQELRQKHFLAADLICKTLCVDMDREHWDWFQSLCSVLIMFAARTMFLDCDIKTLEPLGVMYLSEGNVDMALLVAKACMAIDAEEPLCKDLYDKANEMMQKKKEKEEKASKNRRASGSRGR